MSAKITALASLGSGAIADNDPLVVVDVSDTTMAPTGTDKGYLFGDLKTDLLAAFGAFARISGGDFNTASTSLVDVTGMQVPLAANGTYEVVVIGSHISSSSTEGMYGSINGSTAAANVVFNWMTYIGTNTFSGVYTGAAYDAISGVALSGPGANERPFCLQGLVTNGAAASTLSFRVRAETGGANSITVKDGAVIFVKRVA